MMGLVSIQNLHQVLYSLVFGGTYADANTYTNPSGSESWAGFANEDASVYPFTFGDGGSISFNGFTNGASADIYFRFEYNPYPDTDPSYNTTSLTLGPESTEYTLNIPSQGGNTFSSFLLYVTTPDVAVTLNNVTVNTSDISGPIDLVGCMDANASNYNADATVPGYDQYGNLQCVYASCDDIPEYGCIYTDGFGAFNDGFDAAACESYGGTPCEQASGDVSGCTNPDASNYNGAATVDDGSCEYCYAPADWDVIVTGSNHTIVIPSSATVTLADGNILDHANVGVFYTNSEGNLACAGSAEITSGETVQIAAMGDDTTTPEVDGLVSGSDLIWLFYQLLILQLL